MKTPFILVFAIFSIYSVKSETVSIDGDYCLSYRVQSTIYKGQKCTHYCCGTCYNRYCCKDGKLSIKNQSKCTNNEEEFLDFW